MRDYEGNVDVNKGIAKTLKEPLADIDFWWLNNGVTILASKAGFANGKMNLQNPLIVNGLQTSFELHRWMKGDGKDEKRLIMVRIIETSNEDVMNSIIKATNYQTKVKAHSLRATEEIQRKIEIFLLSKNIYYDRRRNFYKNSGKPAARIIGIDRMAQAVASLLLEIPHTARARPISLMKSPEYDQIFPAGENEFALEVYQIAAESLFAVTTQLSAESYDRLYKNNLRFHILMCLGWHLCGTTSPKPKQLAAVELKKLKKAPLKKIADWVIQQFDATDKTDAVAKDSQFADDLKIAWQGSGIA